MVISLELKIAPIEMHQGNFIRKVDKKFKKFFKGKTYYIVRWSIFHSTDKHNFLKPSFYNGVEKEISEIDKTNPTANYLTNGGQDGETLVITNTIESSQI